MYMRAGAIIYSRDGMEAGQWLCTGLAGFISCKGGVK